MTAKFSSSDSLLPDGQALLFFVMRCLMYAHSYNDYQMARDAFARLPPGTRSRLGQTDFSAAERRCPRHMAITALMRRAARDLGPIAI